MHIRPRFLHNDKPVLVPHLNKQEWGMSSSHWSDRELSFGSKMRDLGFQVLLEQIAFSSVSGLCLVHRGKQLKKSTLELRVRKGSIIFLFLLPLLKIRPLSFLLGLFCLLFSGLPPPGSSVVFGKSFHKAETLSSGSSA